MKRTSLALLLAVASGAALAQSTPVGLWKTFDEQKRERSMIRISESAGVLTGRIEKTLGDDRTGATCEACTDERKGQPLAGLVIVRGVKKDPADADTWQGGDILDPANGKSFNVRLKLVDGGKALEMRAYLGSPLMGRTQTWVRVE